GSEINHYGVLDDTTVYVVTNRYNKEEIRTGNALYCVTAGRSNENREELVLGILYAGGRISEAVEAFNKENQDYYVTFKDYSEFQEPRKQAVLDMMSGNAPDILCTNGFHTAQLTGQKLLEDLYPYLSDSGLEKELDSNILKLLSDKEKHDGAPENPLYELCLSYRIDAVITGKNCLEDGKRWSDTLTEQAGENGQFLAGMSESELLDQLVANNFDRLVDASNKRCYFASDEFAALLECAKELADDRLKYMDSYGVLEGALDGIESGKALGADFCSLEGIFNYQILSGFYPEGISVVPYPLTQTEGVGFTAGNSYGICSASGHKEGAWEFLKFQLEEEWQENYAGDDEVPMNKKALNRYIERVTAVDGYMDENQQFIEPVDRELSLTDMTIKLRPVSESEEELFRELLLSVGHQSRQDEMISEIVQDEAKAYFDGTRTGRDVMGRIQNRVSMYLQE
ncbi:MAG: extracellular solute-binding protein, partial [Lachnospiraceae bacterium]|nr:extracellular solute-binding protein [Lachnospiraceae bacterium]